MCLLETPWENTPSLNSTMSVIYLGIVPTGVAWLLRFKILKKNGLIFQSQVSYLIPIWKSPPQKNDGPADALATSTGPIDNNWGRTRGVQLFLAA